MCARTYVVESMERSSRDRATATAAAARPWLHFLLLSLAAGAVLQVQGQTAPDSTGFISIDCGLPEQIGSYVDELTKLRYTSDAGFTDAGVNQNVSAEHIDPSYTKRYPQVLNVRAFPGGAAAPRSCYTFPSLASGSKYLVRATFMYGNYDGLNKLPVFDLHLGVNFWNTVNLTSSDEAQSSEIIAVVPGDSLQVCLVDIGSGTPFISWLDLRPLKNTMYPQVNATQALVLFDRSNFGAIEKTIRYPDDPYDRAWMKWSTLAWWSVSTIQKVQQKDEDGDADLFPAPSVVMQTAITPLNASRNIEFSYVVSPNHVNPTPRHIFVLYFAEVEILAGSDVRMFSVSINNYLPLIYAYKPRYLVSDIYYNLEPLLFSSRYNFTLKATAPNSTQPPAINAAEFFSLVSTANVGTDAQDVFAITAIKAEYQVKKNWAGDPCSPKTVAWDGLNCSYPISSPPTITSLNMSLGGLNGYMSSHFGNLKAIQYLDLSHNKLTGPIPDVLSLLPSLVVLDLSDNRLSGSIPSGLLKKAEDGSLTLRYDNNPSLCTNSSSCQATKKKSNSMLAVYIVVPIFAVVLTGALVVLLLFLMRKKQGSAKCNVKKRSDVIDEQWQSQSQSQSSDGRSSLLQLDNRRFTYRELEVMTDDFRRVLGRGGFGCVYDGVLEDGTRVAIKLRSDSSNQGVTEFLAEVRSLAKIHHKNLVSLIGYCKDGEYMALVYEHMSEGNLQDKLRGRDGSVGCLTWRQRLRIALESAQGLEYLHKSCSPPLLHRDVKTSNILLSANLKAKVADFGLLKAFNHDDDTHVSTARVVGTHGYLAPEYAAALQLTEKSDVYSFGVVLLEVITGQPPILQSRAPANIIEWVRQRLARGNIEDVVDACMRGDYDVNSVWKAADVALRCSSHAPAARPTMTDVAAHLQECLELEESRTGGDDTNASDPNSSYSMYNSDQSPDVRQSSRAFEMEHNFGRTLATGPATR